MIPPTLPTLPMLLVEGPKAVSMPLELSHDACLPEGRKRCAELYHAHEGKVNGAEETMDTNISRTLRIDGKELALLASRSLLRLDLSSKNRFRIIAQRS